MYNFEFAETMVARLRKRAGKFETKKCIS